MFNQTVLLSAVSTVSGLKSTLLNPINMVHNWESLDTCCEWLISFWTCSKKWQRRRRRGALKTSTRGPEKRRWRGWNKQRRKGMQTSRRGLKNFANKWKNWSWGRRRYSEPGLSASAVKHDFVDVFLKHFFFSLRQLVWRKSKRLCLSSSGSWRSWRRKGGTWRGGERRLRWGKGGCDEWDDSSVGWGIWFIACMFHQALLDPAISCSAEAEGPTSAGGTGLSHSPSSDTVYYSTCDLTSLSPALNESAPTRRPTVRSWQPCWKESRRTGGWRPHEGKEPSLTLPGWNAWLKSSFSWSRRGRPSLTSYTGEHQDSLSPDPAGTDSCFSSDINQCISTILGKKLSVCGRNEKRSGRRRETPENGLCKR